MKWINIKTVRMFFIIFVIVLLTIFGGTLFAINYSFGITEIMYFPSKNFPIYVIEPQNVMIKMVNAVMVALFFTIILTLFLGKISNVVKQYLHKKGMN